MGNTRSYLGRYNRYIGKVMHIDRGRKYVYAGKLPNGYTFRIIPDGILTTVNYQTFREYLHERKVMDIIGIYKDEMM